MEKKQTAVQWLLQQIENNLAIGYNNITKQQHEQALQMEREQIINFHIEVMKQGLISEGDEQWQDAYFPKIKEEAEKTYTQTFKP
jgi:hypothetical protein